jgi:hypothetical protein
VILLVLMASGCASKTQAPDLDLHLNGEAAFAFVKGLALQPDGSPRYRIPGTEGQAEGASFLWQATNVPGWHRQWQNVTGQDYESLDRSLVASYLVPGQYDGPGQARGCTASESEAVRGLPFYNLLAIRDGPPDAPIILLAAHWDSQMHSDFDPDPAKRDLPDPGANDGASGVGVLLQLMRELEGQALPFRVGVLFIDGEDGFFDCYPLVGSLAFAQRGPLRPAAFVLLDMVGDPKARFPRESQSTRALQDIVWRHGRAANATVFQEAGATITDDHVPFLARGVPAIDVIDAGRSGTPNAPFPPQWDTTHDTVDKLDPAMLGLVGGVLLASLHDPAMAALVKAT